MEKFKWYRSAVDGKKITENKRSMMAQAMVKSLQENLMLYKKMADTIQDEENRRYKIAETADYAGKDCDDLYDKYDDMRTWRELANCLVENTEDAICYLEKLDQIFYNLEQAHQAMLDGNPAQI